MPFIITSLNHGFESIIMEPNIIQIDKQTAEYIEFYHYISDLNFEKINTGEEIKLKIKSK